MTERAVQATGTGIASGLLQSREDRVTAYGNDMTAAGESADVRSADRAGGPAGDVVLSVGHALAGVAMAGLAMVGGSAVGLVMLSRLSDRPGILEWLPWLLQLAVNTSQIAILAGLAIWAVGSRWSSALGLRLPKMGIGSWIGIGLALFVIKAASTITVNAAIGGVSVQTLESLKPFADTMTTRVAPLLLLAAAFGAVAEEVIFRGALSPALERTRLGFWGGAGIASILWAAAHPYYPLAALAALFVIGMTLSWVRRRTGSILPGMAWHVANNLLALGVMGAMLSA
jgi:membrane protease YdiL (CAAX protease family)